MTEKPDHEAPSPRPLERRGGLSVRGGEERAHKRRGAAKSSIVVAVPAFKQALLKYVRRQVRQGRTFSLAVLEILEYGHVRHSLGEGAAQQLLRMTSDVCARRLRDADRLCPVGSGKFLMLLPDTDGKGATQAMERVAQSVAQAKTHYHHKALRASCSFRIVDSSSSESDPEALLAELGYGFDQAGNLVQAQDEPGGAAMVKEKLPVFKGSFANWAQRYDNLMLSRQETLPERLAVGFYDGFDLWRNKADVVVKTVEPAEPEDSFSVEELTTLARRACLLQSIDHPGVTHLTDFHVREGRTAYLVSDRRRGVRLDARVTSAPLDVACLLEWGLQICNSVIYLQSMIPPVVPPPFQIDSFLLSEDGHLVLVDYELPFLFPSRYVRDEISGDEILAVNQGRPVAAYGRVIVSLGKLLALLSRQVKQRPKALEAVLAALGQDQLPDNLNTVYKLRSALKEIADAERLKT